MSDAYCLSMSGSSVRRPDTLVTANTYLEKLNWDETRRYVVSENLYQLNAESSRKRVAGEIVKRLRTLTDDEVRFLVESYGDDQSAMLWVSVCRTYQFVYDLSGALLHDRYDSGVPTYTEGAYEAFFEQESQVHPELEKLTTGSRKKMRNQIWRMILECNLASEDGTITPLHPSPDFSRVIDDAHRDDLSLFPGVSFS